MHRFGDPHTHMRTHDEVSALGGDISRTKRGLHVILGFAGGMAKRYTGQEARLASFDTHLGQFAGGMTKIHWVQDARLASFDTPLGAASGPCLSIRPQRGQQLRRAMQVAPIVLRFRDGSDRLGTKRDSWHGIWRESVHSAKRFATEHCLGVRSDRAQECKPKTPRWMISGVAPCAPTPGSVVSIGSSDFDFDSIACSHGWRPRSGSPRIRHRRLLWRRCPFGTWMAWLTRWLCRCRRRPAARA